MARLSVLIALAIISRCALSMFYSCPNCQGFKVKCDRVTNATYDATFYEELSPKCVICTSLPEHTGRDVVPTCPLVKRTKWLWLRNFRLDYLSLLDLSHLQNIETLYVQPGTKAVLLQWNKLEIVTPDYFRQLSSVMLLDLRYNRIHTIYRVSENIVQEWQNELVSCTAVFALDGVSITAKNNVSRAIRTTAVPPSLKPSITANNTLSTVRSFTVTTPLNLTIATENATEIDQIVFLLNTNQKDKVEVNVLDLVITSLLTLSILVFCYFIIQSLQKNSSHNSQNNQTQNGTLHHQQTFDEVSQHAYDTIEDQPETSNQKRDTLDGQVPTISDDIITPYGQAVLSGAYQGMDTALNAIPSRSQDQVPENKSNQTPYDNKNENNPMKTSKLYNKQ
uniref:LRRNT domain-containing protein n=1 Tax=Branchiostoma floridae TaxID=7739 RepID=C3YG18_BRAFL|eukprot:XP_002604813.1 hypothetical protein BRAFLDRAFT_70663 [Branchiostoma floridae]